VSAEKRLFTRRGMHRDPWGRFGRRDLGFRVSSLELGFGVQGSGFGVYGLGFRVKDLWFRV